MTACIYSIYFMYLCFAFNINMNKTYTFLPAAIRLAEENIPQQRDSVYLVFNY